MAWIDRLASEISDQIGEVVSTDELYEKFAQFRSECRDPILKDSYPEDIHHFKKSQRPQASTKDIILSFMDRHYPNLSVPMTQELAVALENAADKEHHANELDRVLIKERHRRFATGPKRKGTYWGINQERLRAKYDGLYALLRIDSAGVLKAEPFGITVKPRYPTNVCAYWACDGRARVGDLLVNTYRLSGTTVCKSTDDVIEPVSLAFLRAPRVRRDLRPSPLVLGGFLVGWKDDDPTALFHSRIALIKLDFENAALRSVADFLAVAKLSEVCETLAALLAHPIVQDSLAPDFLRNRDLAMTSLEARNALLGISHEMVSVRKT